MIGVIGNLEVKVTDPENKQRISIYIDRDLVKKADGLSSLAGCKSRNEFVSKASYDDERNSINDFIANANIFIDIQELTPEIVHAFISKIYVHEKKEKWSRTEGNDIDIVFTVGFREQHTVRTSDAIAS